MKDLQKAWRARNWMKNNEAFLQTWHAYVGDELGLFKSFEKPKTVMEVSKELGVKEDLLQRWVDVGSSINHLRKRTGGRYRTSKKHCGEFLEEGQNGIGALLKEMMELHIPTLLSYPQYMKSGDRAQFNHEKFGGVVAETSTLLEQFSIRRIKKMVREKNVSRIIDLGCGHGGYLRKLAEAFPNIQMVGVDVNERVIQRAKEESADYENIQFIVGDASSWEPDGDKADLILLHNLFHYLEQSERLDLLNHLSALLEGEGMISVITPIDEAEEGQAFSSAFNSFFTAHSNLHPLPSEVEIHDMATSAGLSLTAWDPIVKEGGWYAFWLSPQVEYTIRNPEA
ncbi:class I SAM-dependent methyltransferase [Pontibacillus marinus]|uniref:Methyltransferase domain-containing protein n=1 Tax=Pontibacillus marinus BH030004 = DSM 16465 TaxID=1385511 RepID=A0A0A5GE49_9BACI|nr:class I SAM-dependent methyltransferase [Pontibacillus marinus]KGX90284.1 hypothetical protein N783_21070 [Pontibacillus marinus BH030004 = DSM 16465]